MAGPSTKRALNDRALRTANWFHNCAQGLESKMEKQNIHVGAEQKLRDDPSASYSRIRHDGDRETEVMVALEAGYLIHLILDMYRQEAELRRFAEPIKLRRR
jgi:hypothetical protein